MRIKQAAAQTGLTEKAIRLYEQHGLIRPACTEVAGRTFRDYGPDTVEQLRQIAVLRKAGFTLDEIAALQTGAAAPVVRAYRARLAGELAQKQAVLAALQAPAADTAQDAAALAALLADAVRAEPLPEPELHFSDDAAPPLPRTGLWLWNGLLPWRLHGGPLALALALRAQPMTWPQLCDACRAHMPAVPQRRLRRWLQTLCRRGLAAEHNGVYTVTGTALDRWDSAYTADQLLDWAAATQGSRAGQMFYTSVPPMSVSSGPHPPI